MNIWPSLFTTFPNAKLTSALTLTISIIVHVTPLSLMTQAPPVLPETQEACPNFVTAQRGGFWGFSHLNPVKGVASKLPKIR